MRFHLPLWYLELCLNCCKSSLLTKKNLIGPKTKNKCSLTENTNSQHRVDREPWRSTLFPRKISTENGVSWWRTLSEILIPKMQSQTSRPNTLTKDSKSAERWNWNSQEHRVAAENSEAETESFQVDFEELVERMWIQTLTEIDQSGCRRLLNLTENFKYWSCFLIQWISNFGNLPKTISNTISSKISEEHQENYEHEEQQQLFSSKRTQKHQEKFQETYNILLIRLISILALIPILKPVLMYQSKPLELVRNPNQVNTTNRNME